MQYRWFRPNTREQEVVSKAKIKLKAYMTVEDCKDFDSLVGQVMDQGDYNFQPSKMPNKLPQSKKEDPQIDEKLKANMDWIKVVKSESREQ